VVVLGFCKCQLEQSQVLIPKMGTNHLLVKQLYLKIQVPLHNPLLLYQEVQYQFNKALNKQLNRQVRQDRQPNRQVRQDRQPNRLLNLVYNHLTSQRFLIFS
jgi:hypothetical protein